MSRGRRNVNLVAPDEPLINHPVGPRIELEFHRHNPPTFNGEGDTLEAERWVRALEKIFSFLQCSDRERVSCALYQLVDDADFWWESVRRTISDEVWEVFTWDDFKTCLYQKFIPTHYQHQKANEFWNLKQENKTVVEYDQQFNRLARYAPQTVDTEEKRIEKFRMGLKPEIGAALIGRDEMSYAKILNWALSIEAMQGTVEAQTSQPMTNNYKGKRKCDENHQGYQGKVMCQDHKPFGQQGYEGRQQLCSNCNQHHTGQCRNNGCYQCGHPGHVVRFCPQNLVNGRGSTQQQRGYFKPDERYSRSQIGGNARYNQRENSRPIRNQK